MSLQLEFYLHIVSGRAGEAAVFLARVALNIGYDKSIYPVNLGEIVETGKFLRSPASSGINELFLLDFLRSAVMENIRPWKPDEVERLKVFASSPTPTGLIFSPDSDMKFNS